MEKKAIKFDTKSLTEDGVFEGYASVFGNVDLAKEIVVHGAFKRTIDLRGQERPILWYHNPSEPIGVSLSMQEDSYGLRVRGQLDLDTQSGRDAFSRVSKRVVKGLSIGYRVVRDTVEGNVRKLLELRVNRVLARDLPRKPLGRCAKSSDREGLG